MTKYEKRLQALLTKRSLISLLQTCNQATSGTHCLAIADLENGTYEVIAWFNALDDARLDRRLMRSIMHKSFDEVYSLSLIEAKDLV